MYVLQGLECTVLNHYFSQPNTNLFIPYIFMEWASVRVNEGNNCPDLDGLVSALVGNGYQPWDIPNKLHIEVSSTEHLE